MILSDVCKLHMYSAISKFVFAMPRERKYTVQDHGYCYEIKEIKTELREVVAKLKQTADRMVYIESTGVKTRPVAGFSSREKRIDYGMSLRHGLV